MIQLFESTFYEPIFIGTYLYSLFHKEGFLSLLFSIKKDSFPFSMISFSIKKDSFLFSLISNIKKDSFLFSLISFSIKKDSFLFSLISNIKKDSFLFSLNNNSVLFSLNNIPFCSLLASIAKWRREADKTEVQREDWTSRKEKGRGNAY